jgi:hypothetical protein
LLGLAGLGLFGGCSSPEDRINNLFFGAVKRDPLYLWRPGWATGVIDSESPIGGIISSTSSPGLNHDLQANDLPSTAEAEAVSVALKSGWHARNDNYTYVKPIEGSSLQLIVDFGTATDLKFLTMRFSGGNA